LELVVLGVPFSILQKSMAVGFSRSQGLSQGRCHRGRTFTEAPWMTQRDFHFTIEIRIYSASPKANMAALLIGLYLGLDTDGY